jgi:hypothetical protein
MIAANDNLSADQVSAIVESILDEYDILCLGTPSPERLEREIATRLLH